MRGALLWSRLPVADERRCLKAPRPLGPHGGRPRRRSHAGVHGPDPRRHSITPAGPQLLQGRPVVEKAVHPVFMCWLWRPTSDMAPRVLAPLGFSAKLSARSS